MNRDLRIHSKDDTGDKSQLVRQIIFDPGLAQLLDDTPVCSKKAVTTKKLKK